MQHRQKLQAFKRCLINNHYDGVIKAMDNNTFSIRLIQENKHQSPFDAIRHTEENTEYWYARELMSILSYSKWQKFKNVIESAQENLETITNDVNQHFLPVEVKSQGRPALDYKLSRLACYHIALCCDSRGNDAVKSAKHYFAIKTREAEVIIPQQSEEIKSLELQRDVLEMQLKLRQLDNSMLIMHGKQTVLALRGYDQAVVEVEKKLLEVIDQRSGDRREGMTTKQINDYYQRQTGSSFKNGAVIKRILEKEAPELIDVVQRPINQDWVLKENIDQVIEILKRQPRQMLLGE